jgi:TonB family protein
MTSWRKTAVVVTLNVFLFCGSLSLPAADPLLNFTKFRLPYPPYPYRAWLNHEQGTVQLHVVFGSGGHVLSCKILKSSGSALLDNSTVYFIKGNWHNFALAGKAFSFPVTYTLNQ